MQGKADWTTKQAVSLKIVAQLATMTEDEKRAFIVKLLDQCDPTFVHALELAYNIAPDSTALEQEKR